jgi:hypothetical protein
MAARHMLDEQQTNYQDVAGVITAMTDGEKPYLFETTAAVLADPSISQVVLCVEQNNTWVDTLLSSLSTDPRLKIVQMPMAFLGEIRNRALDHVDMPWVAYCDGDDVWCPGKIFNQRSCAEATKSDFVGADHCLINEDGKVCAFALARNIPMPSSWLVRTEIMKKYPFDGSLPSVEDGNWWVHTPNAFVKARCPKILLKYRVRLGSLSTDTPPKRRKTRIVNFTRLPILKEIVFLLTWCIWMITRQEEYIWLKEWGAKPLAVVDQPGGNS